MSRHHAPVPKNPWLGDIMASLVVTMIALPLSLGIALASGAPMASAVVAMLVGGLLVGAIAGAPLVVTGPAAGLSALILQLITDHGLEKVFIITVMAGGIQVVLSIAKLGRTIEWIPKSVLEGVLSAIGMVIVLGQLHVLVGGAIPGGSVKSLLAFPAALGSAFSSGLGSMAFSALLIGSLAIVLQLLWKRWAKGRMKTIPAALPAIVIATLVSLNFDLPRVNLQPLGSYVGESLLSVTDQFRSGSWLMLFGPALGLAVVASAESLLTAKAVQVLADKRHLRSRLSIDRELLAQGAGNMISGVLGGIPMTGVMVRSAANVEAGARTRASAMLHAVWIAMFVFLFPSMVQTLPSSALAAVLILTGFKLMNIGHLLQAVVSNPRQAYLWPMTAIAVLSTDLLRGLIIGISVASLDAVVRWSSPQKTPASRDESLVVNVEEAGM